MQQVIVTLTMNPSLDKSTKAAHVMPEHKLRCEAARMEPGGGGLNVARALYKLGGAARALFTSGGSPGAMLQQLLEKEGIAQHALPIQGATRESFAVLEESTGQQYRFVLPGPTLQEAEWQGCLDVLATLDPKPDWIVASGSLPPGVPDDFYARVAQMAHSLGARAIVDTSGAALRAMAQAEVYLLKPNLRELSQLANQPLNDEEQQERVARELIETGHSQAVVVSIGAAGALLVSKEDCLRVRSPSVPVISKIGAGDSLTAGLTLALARGWPLRQAVAFGVAAGAAAVVMTPGTELCRREDAEKLYQRLSVALT